MEIVGAAIVIGLIGFALWKQVTENLTKNCPECGKRIPDRAARCPYCDYRFARVPLARR